jgi:hypothetical protein
VSSFIYFLAEYYPWWGLPLALIMIETSNHFRRGGKRGPFILFFGTGLLLIALAVLYFVNGGFFTVRPTIQNLERQYSR